MHHWWKWDISQTNDRNKKYEFIQMVSPIKSWVLYQHFLQPYNPCVSSLSPPLSYCLFNKCRWPFHLSKDYVCGVLLSRSCRAMCICLLARYSANKLPLWKHLNIEYDRRCNKIRLMVSPDTPTQGLSLSVPPHPPPPLEVYIRPKSSRRLNSTVQL